MQIYLQFILYVLRIYTCVSDVHSNLHCSVILLKNTSA